MKLLSLLRSATTAPARLAFRTSVDKNWFMTAMDLKAGLFCTSWAEQTDPVDRERFTSVVSGVLSGKKDALSRKECIEAVAAGLRHVELERAGEHGGQARFEGIYADAERLADSANISVSGMHAGVRARTAVEFSAYKANDEEREAHRHEVAEAILAYDETI